MGSWPLIVRELRVLSRQGQLFWIRVIGGTCGFATLSFILLREVLVGAQLGAQIFAALNAMIFATILFVGPLVTCDCIAQEKREGTLGLLFLAPLSGRNIVLSKLIINALRAFTLLLAVLPMMALPVVFGGIGSRSLLSAITLQLTALCIALSAGLLASTLHRSFIQAAVLGEIYALGLGAICGLLLPVSVFVACATGVMFTYIVIDYCSRALKQKWEEESSVYKEPLWGRIVSETGAREVIFRWDTNRARSRNPIAWLQEYSWSARLAKWGWFLLTVITELALVADAVGNNRSNLGQWLLLLALVLGLSLSGANSFRQERLSGAMELLLVTPLSPLAIILGRLWGIWVHFFPAFAVVALLWLSAGRFLYLEPALGYIVISTFLFVPPLSLYISLLPWHIIVSWVVIFLAGSAFPFYISRLFFEPGGEGIVVIILLQGLIAAISFMLLYHKLKHRTFRFV